MRDLKIPTRIELSVVLSFQFMCASLLLIFVALGMISGDSFWSALRSSFLILISAYICGCLLLCLLPGVSWTLALLSGLSLASSALLIILLGQTAHSISIQLFVLLLMAVISTFLARRETTGKSFQFQLRKITAISYGLAAGLGLLSLGILWIGWPLARSSPWFLNSDAPIHESFASSLSIVGPDVNLALQGSGIRYHWFSDAFIGELTSFANATPYASLTRSLYIFCLITLIFLAMSVTRQFWNTRVTDFGSVVGVFALNIVPIGLSRAGSLPFIPFYPSFTFSMVFILSLTVLCVGWLDKAFPNRALILISLFFFAIVGSRITSAGVVLFATLMLFVFSIFKRRNQMRNLLLTLVALVSVLSGVLFLLRPHVLGTGNGWALSPNWDIASELGLILNAQPWGILLAVFSVTLAMFIGGAGLLLVRKEDSLGILWEWVLAIVLAGFLGLWLTKQSGSSHFTFMYPGLIILYALSGAATCRWVVLQSRATRVKAFIPMGLVTAVGVATGVGVELLSLNLQGYRFEGIVRTILPFSVAGIALLAGFSVSLLCRGAWPKRTLVLGLTVICSLSCVVAGNLLAATISFVNTSGSIVDSTQMTLSREEIAAGEWVRRNTSVDAVFAGNNLCSVPSDTPPYCFSANFPISSLAQRQALIEGQSFSVEADLFSESANYSWAIERLIASDNFARNPSQDSLETLWKYGVRYFWLDTAVEHSDNLGAFSDVLYNNSRIRILELRSPLVAAKR